MDKFYPDINALDAFTLSLDCLGEQIQCKHCKSSGQLVSHGFVYKQHSSVKKEAVGKRLFCSNRYGRSGCGRTIQLYVAQAIPTLQYDAAQLFIFVSSLLMNLTLEDAYQTATGQVEPRHAWRWLKKLMYNLTNFRCSLKENLMPLIADVKTKNRRLKLLLPTLQRLFTELPHCPCVHYQLQRQCTFI